MHRTTIFLPLDLADRARDAALQREVSLGAFVRAALAQAIGDARPAPIGGILGGDDWLEE